MLGLGLASWAARWAAGEKEIDGPEEFPGWLGISGNFAIFRKRKMEERREEKGKRKRENKS